MQKIFLIKWLIFILIIIGVATGGYYYFSKMKIPPPPIDQVKKDIQKQFSELEKTLPSISELEKLNKQLGKQIPLAKQRSPGKRITHPALGISFMLPADFELKKNKSSFGFDYLTIIYPMPIPGLKETEFYKRVEKTIADCDLYCAVIRPSATLFPYVSVKNNEDIKTYLKEIKEKEPSSNAAVIKEWEQDGMKFLHFFTADYGRQIISIESQSPPNLIAVIMRDAGKYAEQTIELAKSIKIIGQSTYTKPQTAFLTYLHKRLGIQFQYPFEWGPIEYILCSERTEPLTAQDDCIYVTLTLADLNAIFLSSSSVFSSQYPPERGSYWGDTARDITDESVLWNYCSGKDSAKCKVYRNSNDVLVVRSIEDACTEGGCNKNVVMYYIKAKNPEFLGIVLSTDRLKYRGDDLRYPPIPDLENKMDELVDSLRFLKR